MVVSGANTLASTAAASSELDPTALPAPPSKLGDRFAAARRDPGYEAALATKVSLLGARDGAPSVIFRVVPLVLVLAGLHQLWEVMTFPGPVDTFGVLFLCVWIGLVGGFGWKGTRWMTGRQAATLACVVAKQTVPIVHHREHGHATTLRSQVTLELEDGRRLALHGADEIIGALIEDDVGVAYMQGTRLRGFRRLAT